MPAILTSAGAPRPTRGKTVGCALIRSYLHDFENRNSAEYKPLYTQAQFNRMVAGLRSETEHRVYAQYVALYNGIVEEFARAHGYYQQAQNALSRLGNELYEALRAEQADRLLDSLPPFDMPSRLDPEREREDEAKLRAKTIYHTDLVLHVLSYYDEPYRLRIPEDVDAGLREFHAGGGFSPMSFQLSFMSDDNLTLVKYEILQKNYPRLLEAIESELERHGISKNTFPTWGTLADRNLYDFPMLVNPSNTDPNNPLPALRSLFSGLSNMRRDVPRQENLRELRDEMLLPSLRWLCAYNALITHLSGTLALPKLTILLMYEEDSKLQLAQYNREAELLQTCVYGHDAPEKAALAGRLFPPIPWPVLPEDSALPILKEAEQISAYDSTTLQRFVLTLMEVIP